IVDIETPEPFAPPATLALVDRSGAAAGREAVMARYDVPSAVWLALATVTLSANGPPQLAGVTGAGQFALLLPDTGDGAPPPAVLGMPLAAGAVVPIPANAVASGVVRPPVGRADDPHRPWPRLLSALTHRCA